MRAYLNNVIFKKIELKHGESGGIVLPDMNDRTLDSILGEVTAVGPGDYIGTDRREIEIKVGDVIVAPTFASARFTFDGEDYFAVKDTDVYVVI